MRSQITSRFDAALQLPWSLWRRQVAAIFMIECKKNISMRRRFWIFLLAFAPVVIIGGHSLESPLGSHCDIQQDTLILAGIFQIYYVRLGIFFGCIGIFTWLFRGEMVERSLHYYFLAPVRREVLVVGKFLAGVFSASLLFSTGVLASFALMYGHFGPKGYMFVFQGPGLRHLGSYLLIVVLACMGYGAIALALSMFFRNIAIPGLILLGWESINPALPALLQKMSVTHYLRQLAPVEVAPSGLLALFRVVTEPTSAWVSVLGLVVFTLAVLVFTCFSIRRMEISYAVD